MTYDEYTHSHAEALLAETYALRALRLAELIGVLEYTVKGPRMLWFTNWPGEHATYRVIIDLNSGKETRERLSRYYTRGNANICL